jgi:hypothetical protein
LFERNWYLHFISFYGKISLNIINYCSKSTSKYSDQYNKIIVESMGGHGDNDFDKEEKIIKKVSKGVIVEKL